MSVSESDDALAALLTSWGLSHDVVRTFQAQDIDVDSLEFLDAEAVLKLLPTLGPRARFLAKREKYLKDGGSSADWLPARVDTAAIATSSATTNATSSDTSSDTSSASPRVNSSVSTSNSSRRSAANGRTTLLSSYKNSIDKLLDECLEGQLVLAGFKKFGKLDDSLRDQLVKCTIFHLFRNDHNTRLDSATFQTLAEDIEEVFSTEAPATYFSSYKKNKKNVLCGRLVIRYHNLRRKLIAVGLIPKRSVEEELFEEEGLDYGPDLNIEEDEDFRWLSTNIRPWPSVLEAWARTRPTRMSLLRGLKLAKVVVEEGEEALDNQISDTPSYLEYFKPLSVAHGWELFCDDFDNIHPSHHLTLSSQWPKVLAFARSKLGIRGSSFLDDAKTTSDQKTIELLSKFSELFKVRNVPTDTKKSWRVSRAEVQRSFVLHALTEGAWKSAVNDRLENLGAQGQTLQPYIVFIGPLTGIKKIRLVYTAKSSWDFDSPLQALDAAFKSFFATDTGFPAESRHIWTFLQQAVYGIETKSDYTTDPALKAYLSGDKKEFSAIRN